MAIGSSKAIPANCWLETLPVRDVGYCQVAADADDPIPNLVGVNAPVVPPDRDC